jgi:glycopeptide antibiotics resistance protein
VAAGRTSPSGLTRGDQGAAHSGLVRKALIALFAVYLALLVWAIVWKVHVPFIGRDDMRGIKLVPFAAGDGFGFSDPYELLANLLLFVPLGIYLGALGARGSVPIIVGTSLALEVAQYVLATGSSDITDVIVNTAGGLVGLLFARVPHKPLVWVLGIGTALAIVAIVVVIVSFPRMPQGGGIVIQSVVTR